jgi:putative transposase
MLDQPNQAWVADITYVRLPSCFIYLACILDAWSGRCVGWRLSRSIDTQFTLAALNHAITLRWPEPGLIHHSDDAARRREAPSRRPVRQYRLRGAAD